LRGIAALDPRRVVETRNLSRPAAVGIGRAANGRGRLPTRPFPFPRPTRPGRVASFSAQGDHMRRSPITFLPRLETLGDRVIPAVNASIANNVLTITDDGTGTVDNQVRVRLNGNNVEVTSDGQTQTFRNAARSLSLVNADLGAGNDSLTLDLDDLDG